MNLYVLKTFQDYTQFTNWIKALRSGNYNQGFGRLQNIEIPNTYCCLGVACVVCIPQERLEFINYKIDGKWPIIKGSLPAQQWQAPTWLLHINNFVGLSKSPSLTELNDKYGYSFNGIADEVEALLKKEIDYWKAKTDENLLMSSD
jgi:hypothetical protein